MVQPEQPGTANSEYEYLPKPENITKEYMHELLVAYYDRKWNTNENTINIVKRWKNWPILVRMPDIGQDFTVIIDDGKVSTVTAGMTEKPRILSILLAETMQRVYYDVTTMAIESVAGRVKVRGDETERRRLLGALSYLTW